MEPLVSVICITRNHERFCIESLDSVFNQTYKNIEWIILDAASTDNTVELIDNWLKEKGVRAVFFKEKELKPITVNLNKAITVASGEFLQLLSLDDLLVKEKITTDVGLLKQKSDLYSLVFGMSQIIDADSNLQFDVIPNGVIKEHSDNYFDQLVTGNIISATAVLMRTSVLRVIGCYNEFWPYEDYPLWLKLANSGYLFIYNPTINSYYRRHHTSFSGTLDFKETRFELLLEYSNVADVRFKLRKELLDYGLNDKFKFKKLLPLYLKFNDFDFRLRIVGWNLPKTIKVKLLYFLSIRK